MSKITGNEPAVPCTAWHENGQIVDSYQNGNTTASYIGLTIRQRFAMAAMTGLLVNMPKTHMDDALPMVSKQSVRFADALINELNKQDNG